LVMLNISLEKRRTLILASNGMLFALSATFGLLKYAQLGIEAFPYAATIVCVLIGLNSIYLLLGGDLANSEAMMMTILLGGYAGATTNTGAFDGAPSILAPILPLIGILWFGTQAGWKILVIITGMLGLILYFDLQGVFRPLALTEEAVTISRFLTVISTALICTWIAWAFAQSKELDITNNKQQASQDHLTGLSNRRALDRALLREVGRARRDGSWLSLIIADVDFFKRFNDTNGHQAGDKCLIEVANLFNKAVSRPCDVVSRFGGEEFAVLLPNTGPEGAFIIAERIRRAMISAQIPYDVNGDEFLSLTLGVIAIEGSNIKSVVELVAEADAALYRGKSSGRNKVVIKSICASNIGKVHYA
jgi:diguanylate cyclase (GGDEF)-like protein